MLTRMQRLLDAPRCSPIHSEERRAPPFAFDVPHALQGKPSAGPMRQPHATRAHECPEAHLGTHPAKRQNQIAASHRLRPAAATAFVSRHTADCVAAAATRSSGN
eukprot:5096166-Prymnesium_polylepis.2